MKKKLFDVSQFLEFYDKRENIYLVEISGCSIELLCKHFALSMPIPDLIYAAMKYETSSTDRKQPLTDLLKSKKTPNQTSYLRTVISMFKASWIYRLFMQTANAQISLRIIAG